MSNSAITQQVQGLATPTSPGLVGTGAQTFAGVKTFQDGLIPPSSMMFRNKLINGGFDIWQRGTSQTSTGYGSDDRWRNENQGSTKTSSRQTFTLGQTDVPGNPTYFSRTVVASVANANNFVFKSQRLEGVATLSGQSFTFSFWAKADSSKNIAFEMIQNFGTGGSPSAAVTSLNVTTVQLTSSWQRFTISGTLPSISGKTLGTDANDYLDVRWWFDAGSTYNARTNSLGQQSGTFDIANVQLEAGSAATPFEYRPIATEISLCQRYYENLLDLSTSYPQILLGYRGTNEYEFPWRYMVPKRGIPTIYSNLATTNLNTGLNSGQIYIFNLMLNSGATWDAGTGSLTVTTPDAMKAIVRVGGTTLSGTLGQLSILDRLAGRILGLSAEL